jgi:hypothetical protein
LTGNDSTPIEASRFNTPYSSRARSRPVSAGIAGVKMVQARQFHVRRLKNAAMMAICGSFFTTFAEIGKRIQPFERNLPVFLLYN